MEIDVMNTESPLSGNNLHSFSVPCFEINQPLSFDRVDNKRRITKSNFDTLRLRQGAKERHSLKKNNTAKVINENQKVHSSLKIISTFKHVTSFIQKLKYQLLYKDYHNLKKTHLDIIDDMAIVDDTMLPDTQHLPNEENEEGFFQKIKEFLIWMVLYFTNKIKKTFVLIPLFSQGKKVFIVWDLIMIFFCFYYFFIIPVEFSFQFHFHLDNSFSFLLEIFSLFLFIADIFLRFNVTIYEHGNEVRSRKKILINYLKSEFGCDILCVAGVIVHITSETVGIIEFLILLKVARFSQCLDFIEQQYVFSNYYEGILNIFRLTMKILAIAHFLACFFFLFSQYLIEIDKSLDSWIISADLVGRPWYAIYLNGFYWAITTLATVGYGDITPKNNPEKMFCVVVMLLGGGIFAYNINRLSNIFGEISHNSREYKMNMKILNQMMTRKKLGRELQNKIRNYFHYVYKTENKKQIEQENAMLGKLSKEIQNEIILNSNACILKQSKFFCNNFSEEFLQQLVFKMKPKLYSPDEIIFAEGELNPTIFFMVQGRAKIIFDNGNHESIIYEVFPGETFGELNLMDNQEYKYICKCIDFSSIYCISRKDFLETLGRFPSDQEKFFMIKDSIMLYQNYDYLHKKCKLCDSTFHPTEDCNFVLFQSHRERIIYKILQGYKKTKENRRKIFERRKNKTRIINIERSMSSVTKTHHSSFSAEKLRTLRSFVTAGGERSIRKHKSSVMTGNSHEFDVQETVNLSDKKNNNKLAFHDHSLKTNTEHKDSGESDSSAEPAEGHELQNLQTKELLIKTDQLFDYQFEECEDFKFYFPHNNINNIIRKMHNNNATATRLSTLNSIPGKPNKIKKQSIKGRRLFKTNHREFSEKYLKNKE